MLYCDFLLDLFPQILDVTETISIPANCLYFDPKIWGGGGGGEQFYNVSLFLQKSVCSNV